MFYKVIGLYSTKNVNVTKTKIGRGTAPDWRQRDVTLNAMRGPWIGSSLDEKKVVIKGIEAIDKIGILVMY